MSLMQAQLQDPNRPVLPLYPATLASAPTVMNGHCCGHTLFEGKKEGDATWAAADELNMHVGRPVYVWQQKSVWRPSDLRSEAVMWKS